MILQYLFILYKKKKKKQKLQVQEKKQKNGTFKFKRVTEREVIKEALCIYVYIRPTFINLTTKEQRKTQIKVLPLCLQIPISKAETSFGRFLTKPKSLSRQSRHIESLKILPLLLRSTMRFEDLASQSW